jgi:hypothetical protein
MLTPRPFRAAHVAAKRKRSECNQRLGVFVRNPRTSWYAMNADGTIFAPTMWEHEIVWLGRKLLYESHLRAAESENDEAERRLEQVLRVRDNLGGLVYPIIAVATDPNAIPLLASGWYVVYMLVMKIINVDRTARTFHAESIGDDWISLRY